MFDMASIKAKETSVGRVAGRARGSLDRKPSLVGVCGRVRTVVDSITGHETPCSRQNTEDVDGRSSGAVLCGLEFGGTWPLSVT
jgi:hypothetical protein